MMNNRNMHTAPTFTEYLYNHVGHPATHIALRARAQYSTFVADLNRKQYADRITASVTEDGAAVAIEELIREE